MCTTCIGVNVCALKREQKLRIFGEIKIKKNKKNLQKKYERKKTLNKNKTYLQNKILQMVSSPLSHNNSTVFAVGSRIYSVVFGLEWIHFGLYFVVVLFTGLPKERVPLKASTNLVFVKIFLQFLGKGY